MPGQTTLPLQGRTAIITGGSRGLGEGMTLELASRGADVIIIHSSPNSNPATTGLLDRIISLPHKPRAFTIQADLRKPEVIEHIVSGIKTFFDTESRKPKIHILVNNAGCEVVKPLGNITPEDFAYVYDLNVRGALLITQAILPYLADNGRIINISSVGSRAGFKELGLYCSSKAALEGLTRCWAAELGKNGTTVNAVNPGPVQSEMLDNIPKDIVDMQKAQTPLQNRVGTVEEVAAVVCWLSGEDSRWVTGQTINASGGWTMY
ncbi:3-ketoacyl-acyl carrier protein reductase [Leptodontidium sp. 2 PMI_412]|nr:hypothetical protein BKA61DRAFT_637172 [Leptodontidium sp. MPI-SDFR-AT-0119]KAH9211273.1 3-ketoacyl-acyl carrier protein reductase [Leptodontidium sp. 2 PMI_412]